MTHPAIYVPRCAACLDSGLDLDACGERPCAAEGSEAGRESRKAVQIGDTFGEWTVIDEAPPHPFRRGVIRWKVRCSCGATRVREQRQLVDGLTTRCNGCRLKARRVTKGRRGGAARHATIAPARVSEDDSAGNLRASAVQSSATPEPCRAPTSLPRKGGQMLAGSTSQSGATVAPPTVPHKFPCAHPASAACAPPAPRPRPAPPVYLTGPETAAAARRLVASLRSIGAEVPRPGQPEWVDPIDSSDLGPLSDERGAA